MNEFESRLTLSFLLRRCPVVYIEHEKDHKYSYGRYYAMTDTELRHITFDIANCLNMFDEYHLKEVYNRKLVVAEKCLKAKRPDTLVRNLSEALFDRWDTVKFYSLDSERIF